ncbi:hypothetical protein B1R32_10124 [Abditibacterium utsteinense]|uniref:Uncharacterized protein n=1 Tax=Abditibacterium utsteinense TaxID=1960156 RepID=A0A2S8SWW0_9BACT|nr:hypothetical protein [Abditibacterium utsteinense]PQV65286.1 hypothetical protein B1R32_10124 [Abditibacterium utsteinense]
MPLLFCVNSSASGAAKTEFFGFIFELIKGFDAGGNTLGAQS